MFCRKTFVFFRLDAGGSFQSLGLFILTRVIYLSVYLFIFTRVIYLSVYIFLFWRKAPIYLFIYLFGRKASIYLSIYLFWQEASIYLSIYIFWQVRPLFLCIYFDKRHLFKKKMSYLTLLFISPNKWDYHWTAYTAREQPNTFSGPLLVNRTMIRFYALFKNTEHFKYIETRQENAFSHWTSFPLWTGYDTLVSGFYDISPIQEYRDNLYDLVV